MPLKWQRRGMWMEARTSLLLLRVGRFGGHRIQVFRRGRRGRLYPLRLPECYFPYMCRLRTVIAQNVLARFAASPADVLEALVQSHEASLQWRPSQL